MLAFADIVRRISVAPELPRALELGRELVARGIVASIGHTAAIFDEVMAAVEAGFTHVTHIYSSMSGLRRVRAFRIPGVIQATLLLDETHAVRMTIVGGRVVYDRKAAAATEVSGGGR